MEASMFRYGSKGRTEELKFDPPKTPKPYIRPGVHVDQAWKQIQDEHTWLLMWKEAQKAKQTNSYRNKTGKFN